MSTHTPAPWVVGPVDDTVVTHVGRDGVRYEIAAIDGDYNSPDEWPTMEANARLISAAPDMLAAGKHLAVKLAEVYRAAGQSPKDCQAICDWMAAVAKAEGRT